jgi:hypothetical protein
VLGVAGHQPDLLPKPQGAIHDADVGDDSLIIIKLRVEDQGAERTIWITRGGRYALDDRTEDVGDA